MRRKTAKAIRFDAFGPYIYSWGLVHLPTPFDELLCGSAATAHPPMRVHADTPVTCFQCLAKLPCEACDGRGWLETTEDTVERCDACAVFANDDLARAHLETHAT